MPILELPPNPAPPPPPETATAVKVRTRRFGELEEHELIHLLDSLDTEREKARFRESVYISLFIWIAVAWFIFYGPRVLFHQPQVISVADALKQRDKELTYLDMPKPKLPQMQRPTPKPVIDRKTLDQLQALRKAAQAKLPAAPQPQQPAPAPPTQQAQVQPAPPPPLPKVQTPLPSLQPIPDAPRPTQTQPNLGGQQSPSEAMRQLPGEARPSRGGGEYPSVPGRRGGGLAAGGQILTDTQGVDFSAWMRRFNSDVQRNWEPLLPVSFFPPISKRGMVGIRIQILADGNIGNMVLETNSGDISLDKAAWGALVSEGRFPPLPQQFHGPNIEIRCGFFYNETPP